MRILALDFGTKTGWAHSSGASGVWDLSVRKDESSGMRLIRFEAKLLEIINSVGVDLIVFEAPLAFGSRPAGMEPVRLQSKLQAIVERLVEMTDGMECRSYGVQEIKRYAIPRKGVKRDKATMLRKAGERWPDVEVLDDNQADSMWLLDLVQKELKV